MVNAVAQARIWGRVVGHGIGGDDCILGAVAAGMAVHRPASVVAPAHQVGQRLGRDDELAAIVVAQVRLGHGGGAVADAAVDHHLQRVEPQALVAEIAVHRQSLYPGRDLGIPLRAAETPTGQAQAGAQGQVAVLARELVGAQFIGIEPGIGDANQAHGVEGARGATQRGHLLGQSRRRDVSLNHLLGAIPEQAGGLSIAVALEGAGVGLRRVGVGRLAPDAGDGQRATVGDQLVPDAIQADGVARRRTVQLPAGGVAALGQQALVPAGADDPAAGGCLSGALRHTSKDVIDGAAVVELDVGQQQPGHQHVAMRIDQARQDGPTLQCYAPCARPGQSVDLRDRAGGQHLAVAHRQRLDHRIVCVGREDLAARKHDIGSNAWCSARHCRSSLRRVRHASPVVTVS
jgi:hypothetical protein